MAGLCVAAPASAQVATQPIEGVWARSAAAKGRVLVEAAGPNTFRGTIVRGTDPRRCSPDADGFVQPFGAAVWNATGTGASYSGTAAFFNARCEVLGQGQATWTVSGTSLKVCAAPQDGGPTSCTSLVRVAPPSPPPTFASAVTLPAASRCVNRHGLVVRLHDRSNDPPRAAKVTVNGVRRRAVQGAPLTGSIVLRRLPRGRLAVRVVVTTATGRKLAGARSYRTCRG